MVSVVPVRERDYLLVQCTFFATIGPGGQQREYYLSQEMCKVLEEALTTLMNGDRETLRQVCAALFVEFQKVFPRWTLDCVYSYRLDRVIVFEQDEDELQIVVRHMAKGKQLLVLAVEDVSKMHCVLPKFPFRYQKYEGTFTKG